MLSKSDIAGFDEMPQCRVIRLVRLYPDFTGAMRASGSPGDLDNELGCTFRSPEVRAQKPCVCVEEDDQRDVREVMAFGKHLGADHDALTTAVDAVKLCLKCAVGARGIAINPIDRDITEQSVQPCFSTLCAEPNRNE